MFLEAITQSINAFAQDFAKRPFDHLFEADIQADLHGRLRAALQDHRVDFGQVRDHGQLGMRDPFVSRVHAEYPTSRRFDLAIISRCNRDARIWNQPVSAAIEIKLWQADGTGGGINRDLRKLHEYHDDPGTPELLGIALVAGHPRIGVHGKRALALGNFDGRTPSLEHVQEHELQRQGIYVCVVDAGEDGPEALSRVHWWRSNAAPDTEQG